MTQEKEIFAATGRRKTASARVRLSRGSGKIKINGKALEQYCFTEQLVMTSTAPLTTVDLREKVDIIARVCGGGISGQAGAIAHATARALQKMDAALRAPLKKAGYIRRDPRTKERKKPGQPGARKRFQFSKR